MTAAVRAVLLVAAAGAACNRVGGEEGLEARTPLVELRDETGQRRLAVWKVDDGFRWLDRQEGSGRIQVGPAERLLAHDPERGPVEVSPPGPGGRQLRRADGTALRLSREGTLLRLGDGAGIPLARARVEAEEALVHDAGGVVVLRARRAGGRIVVTDREGRAAAFVVGQASPEYAALAALPGMRAVERALLLVVRGP